MFAFVKVLLNLASGLIKYLGDRQLISAGEAKQAAASLRKAATHVEKGRRAMDRVSSDPDERERVRERFTRPE